MKSFEQFLVEATVQIEQLHTRVVRNIIEKLNSFTVDLIMQMDMWRRYKKCSDTEMRRIEQLKLWMNQLASAEDYLNNLNLSFEIPQRIYKPVKVQAEFDPEPTVGEKAVEQYKLSSCDLCGQSVVFLRTHLIQKHGSSHSTKCPSCSLVFQEAYDLARHIFEVHATSNVKGKQRFVCPYTGEVFVNRRQLQSFRHHIVSTDRYFADESHAQARRQESDINENGRDVKTDSWDNIRIEIEH